MDRVVLSGLLSAAQCLSTRLYIYFFCAGGFFCLFLVLSLFEPLVIHPVAGSLLEKARQTVKPWKDDVCASLVCSCRHDPLIHCVQTLEHLHCAQLCHSG
jgi:hypothetical protein